MAEREQAGAPAQEGTRKRGCLGLLLLAVLFAAAVMGAIYYAVSGPRAARASIESCWKLAAAEARSPSQGRLPIEKVPTPADCKKMEQAFHRQYPNARLPDRTSKPLDRTRHD